ncbi:uncharacterized protein LOC106156570 [Lingula anatina]|uniref:RING-type E3 ubiquitin transferase n=1 Tax=Lingula anatina TaxID=7574 RepID=A0A1S3HMP4_LINAN|nr:uncharacterized protein LOC106156570 [Lingula anatina]|eukprot:XP_013387338.1 uncharacterized protein LOC106156570 [Lingula anatina]
MAKVKTRQFVVLDIPEGVKSKDLKDALAFAINDEVSVEFFSQLVGRAELTTESCHPIANIQLRLGEQTVTFQPQVFDRAIVSVEEPVLELLSDGPLKKKLEELHVVVGNCSLSGSFCSLQAAEHMIMRHLMEPQSAMNNGYQQGAHNHLDDDEIETRTKETVGGKNGPMRKSPEVKQNLTDVNSEKNFKPKKEKHGSTERSGKPMKASPQADAGTESSNQDEGLSSNENINSQGARYTPDKYSDYSVKDKKDGSYMGSAELNAKTNLSLHTQGEEYQSLGNEGKTQMRRSQVTGIGYDHLDHDRYNSDHFSGIGENSAEIAPSLYVCAGASEDEHLSGVKDEETGQKTKAIESRMTEVNGNLGLLHAVGPLDKDLVHWVLERQNREITKIKDEHGIQLQFQEKSQGRMLVNILCPDLKSGYNPKTVIDKLTALFQGVYRADFYGPHVSSESLDSLVSKAKSICSVVSVKTKNDVLSLIGQKDDVQRTHKVLSQDIIKFGYPLESSGVRPFDVPTTGDEKLPMAMLNSDLPKKLSSTSPADVSHDQIPVDRDIWDYLSAFHGDRLKDIRRKYSVSFQVITAGDSYMLHLVSNYNRMPQVPDAAFEEVASLHQELFGRLKKEVVNLEGSQNSKKEMNILTAKKKFPNVLFGDGSSKKLSLLGPGSDAFKAKSWLRKQLGLTPRRSSSLNRGKQRESSPERSRPATHHENSGSRGRQSRRDSHSCNAKRQTFHTSEGITLVVYKGDITKDDADVIVSAANNLLNNSAGVAGAISKAAGGSGSELERECRSYIRKYSQLPTRWAMNTSAGGQLLCKKVIHAVGPVYTWSYEQFQSDLYRTFLEVLHHADKILSAHSVAIPLISAGISRMPVDYCASALAQAIHSYSKQKGPRALKEIRLVNITDKAVAAIQAAFNGMFLTDISTHETESSESDTTKYDARSAQRKPSRTVVVHKVGAANANPGSVTATKYRNEGSGAQQNGLTNESKDHISKGYLLNDRSDMYKSPVEHKRVEARDTASSLPEREYIFKKAHYTGAPPQQHDVTDGGNYPRFDSTSSRKSTCAQCKQSVHSRRHICNHCGHIFCTYCFTHNRLLKCPVCSPKLELSNATSKRHDSAQQPLNTGSITPVSQATQHITDISSVTRSSVSGGMTQHLEVGDSDDNCAICMCDKDNPKTLPICKHSFCTSCIDEYFKCGKPVCPVCGVIYGVIQGDQPSDGKMTWELDRSVQLPGCDRRGAYVITYTFPSGIQKEHHPNPGQRYKGILRQAYLPHNKEGREILRLLEKAFDAKVMFTIGHSRTTGREGVITWNDIHHKTNISGGPTNFGYPDPGYLQRVREELAAKGIKLDNKS